MAKIFIGGSRTIRTLDPMFKQRLDRIAQNHRAYVGDAGGADSLVQEYLHGVGAQVEIFYSGKGPRSNRFQLPVFRIETAGNLTGYQFHAAKDRAMAQMSDYGLMIWDGKSPGSLLNILRMVGFGKPSVLFLSYEKRFVEFKKVEDWNLFKLTVDSLVLAQAQSRAHKSEWMVSETDQETYNYFS